MNAMEEGKYRSKQSDDAKKLFDLFFDCFWDE
jgi:hypothetical protein